MDVSNNGWMNSSRPLTCGTYRSTHRSTIIRAMDLNPFSGHGALLFRTMPAPKGCPKPHGRVSGAKIVYDLAFGLGRGSVYPCLPLDHQEEQLGSCETPLGFSRNIKGLVLETEAILTPSSTKPGTDPCRPEPFETVPWFRSEIFFGTRQSEAGAKCWRR